MISGEWGGGAGYYRRQGYRGVQRLLALSSKQRNRRVCGQKKRGGGGDKCGAEAEKGEGS